MSKVFRLGLAFALGVGASLAVPGEAADPASTSRSNPSQWSLNWVTNKTTPVPVALEVVALTPGARETLQNLIRSPQASEVSSLLRLFVEPPQAPLTLDLPPMAGSHEIKPDRIRFQPGFPLQEGVYYRAEFKAVLLPGGGSTKNIPTLIGHYHRPAAPRTPSTEVAHIYPSADRLPENLLKFYLHFSGSMSRGYIYDHIQLLNGQGRAVELPFLEIDQELWNHDLTRLTLLIDPGRIKRGVKPLEDIGPALESGRSFTLVIASAWKDAQGTPLKSEYRKSFQVIGPDRASPDPGQWNIQSPQADSRAPLEIQFGESIDHALAQRLIRVQSSRGDFLPGSVSMHDQEQTWRFQPATPWIAGTHTIVINTILEDLAGNSIGRPFEVDVFEKVDRTRSTQTVSRPFTVTAR